MEVERLVRCASLVAEYQDAKTPRRQDAKTRRRIRTQPQLNLTRSPYAAFLQLHFHLPTAINLSHPNFSAMILMIERKLSA